jgi:hypothetical protein
MQERVSGTQFIGVLSLETNCIYTNCSTLAALTLIILFLLQIEIFIIVLFKEEIFCEGK